ncbi:MAG TPA: hypothetical protein VII52_12110, partial [Gemmatimonadaceae bacterium]
MRLTPHLAHDASPHRVEGVGVRPVRASLADVRELAARLKKLADLDRAAARDTAIAALERFDRDNEFSPSAWPAFQDLLGQWGVATTRPIGLPLDDRPYWLRGERLLANYQSHANLPASADVVVIG